MKNVVLLGSTGSIGTSTIKVAEDLPDRIRLLGLAAGQQRRTAARADPQASARRRSAISRPRQGAGTRRIARHRHRRSSPATEGLLKLATLPAADIVLIAIVGTAGLAARPGGHPRRQGHRRRLQGDPRHGRRDRHERGAAKHGVRVLAVDSEHSAIFQCLDGKPASSVRQPLADGLRRAVPHTLPRASLPQITVERALKHPSWVMGRKITIDSATLFNKGLEMIEARWLFDIEMDRVGVVVHPQSVVHSMVEFVDGSILAQLSTPDMCLPIQYALTYPDRAAQRPGADQFRQAGQPHLRGAGPRPFPRA